MVHLIADTDLKKALELDATLSSDMEQKYPNIKDQVKKVKSKKK